MDVLDRIGLGSSPRMRGAHVEYVDDLEADRDHPRGCGEHPLYQGFPHMSWGSSPRMRGALLIVFGHKDMLRIIPADAGSTVTVTY